MFLILLVIPFAAIVSAVLLYRNTGKRDFLKLDLVQFIYAFVIAPLIFVWMKTFLYYILRQEIDVRLSVGDIFFFDTVFSVVSLFVYAFVVTHSLTKSFELKRYKDPLYDIFTHTEALHLWISHTAMYIGAMALFTLVSMVNVVSPLEISMSKWPFYLILFLAYIAGLFGFAGIWMSNFTDQSIFLKLMKFFIGLAFAIHVAAYFLVDPPFNGTRIAFWMIFMSFFAMVTASFIFERSERTSGWFERFHHKIGWKKGNFLLSKSKFKL